jgi:uncharacterized protein (TIGR02246 family)
METRLEEPQSVGTPPADDRAVRALYTEILRQWNERNAKGMARLFDQDGHVVGFDGSELDGRAAIESELARIFADHQTARYVGVVRSVRFLSPAVALLRAAAGMIPPGHTDLNPSLNAIQTLIAVKRDVNWQIAVYQNTPAAFHGRPDAAAALTEELRQHLK